MRWAFVFVGVVVGACGGSRVPPVPASSPFAGDPSLPRQVAALRHYLMLRDSSVLDDLIASGPKDALVQALTAGLYLHRLDRYAESNRALQRAERLAQDRYTKSISQNVAAFVVSDNVLDYYPSAVEWSMIHYYGMLNYLRLGDVENALVEARKANAVVRRYAAANPGRSFTEPAALQYVAGLVQYGAGERNDGVVSLRTALSAYEAYAPILGVRPPLPVVVDVQRAAEAHGLTEVAERIRAAYPGAADTPPGPGAGPVGDLVVLIENGFVAHRAEQKLFIPVLKSEKDSVLSGDAGSALVAAAKVLIRTVIVMTELSRRGVGYPAHEDGVIIATAGSAVGLELLTLAWPSYRLDARRARHLRVGVDGEAAVEPALLQDLSAIAVRDFEESKPTILLRMVARGLLKEAGVTAAEAAGHRAAGEVGGFLGRVTSRALASATERADTRSWATLPTELRVARFRVSPGDHTVRIAYEGWRGRQETLELSARIEAGGVTVVSAATYGDDGGDEGRWAAAKRGVAYRSARR